MSDVEDLEGLDPIEAAARCPDVYIFYEDTPREPGKVVGRYDEEGPPPEEFRFIADLDPVTDGWGWKAVGIFELPNLFKVTQVGNSILLEPVDPDVSKPIKFGATVLRHTKHYPHFGLARVQVERGTAQDVLRQIDGLTGNAGSAIVAGTYSILVELGGETQEELAQAFADLGAIPGVTHEAGQVVGRYYYRPPGHSHGEFHEVGEPAP